MKLTKRKSFNFFRSYFDVYNELESKDDKVAFIDALLNRQFMGIKPTELTGMAKFAYISQTNSIDSQVKGYEDKTKTKLNPLEQVNTPPTEPPCLGVNIPPSLQVEEKEKEKEKVKDIINNKPFIKKCLDDNQWVEVTSISHKLKVGQINNILTTFENNLISKGTQHDNIKDFKNHFSNWLNLNQVKKPQNKPRITF